MVACIFTKNINTSYPALNHFRKQTPLLGFPNHEDFCYFFFSFFGERKKNVKKKETLHILHELITLNYLSSTKKNKYPVQPYTHTPTHIITLIS